MADYFMVLRRFAVGLILIFLASAILLWSDPKRVSSVRDSDAPKKLAIVNFASVPVLEEGYEGLTAALKDKGFENGKGCEIRSFNAEGDLATASLIAREVVGDNYDLVMTISTPTLQAVAVANTETEMNHVFTLTTDPWAAGVGVSRENPDDHPPYMTGYGSLQPVEELFKMALVANPNLKKVGVVWNPSEANSESSTLAARAACKRFNIELLEATVDTSSGVVDAVKSLISRNVQAIWSGGDSTVSAARDAMVATASDAGIPIFTNMPQDIEQGALFSLGADYYAVAYAGGVLGARVLNGESPADIPVENMVPVELAINLQMLPRFSDSWKFHADWKEKARLIVEKDGSLREVEPSQAGQEPQQTENNPPK